MGGHAKVCVQKMTNCLFPSTFYYSFKLIVIDTTNQHRELELCLIFPRKYSSGHIINRISWMVARLPSTHVTHRKQLKKLKAENSIKITIIKMLQCFIIFMVLLYIHIRVEANEMIISQFNAFLFVKVMPVQSKSLKTG